VDRCLGKYVEVQRPAALYLATYTQRRSQENARRKLARVEAMTSMSGHQVRVRVITTPILLADNMSVMK
jgi:hypothetical protein